jgi:hypothetical protein
MSCKRSPARFVQIMSSRFGEELPINKKLCKRKLVLSHVKLRDQSDKYIKIRKNRGSQESELLF